MPDIATEEGDRARRRATLASATTHTMHIAPRRAGPHIPHPMHPRPAAPDDVPALVRLINRAYVVEAPLVLGERTSESDVRERLAQPGAVFLVLDDADDRTIDHERPAGPLAGAVFVKASGDRGYFGMLSVDPDRQGRGLGRRLARAAEDFCRARGCRVLEIDVVDRRTELPPFYASLGFTLTSTAPFPDPSRARVPLAMLIMTKPIAAAEPGSRPEA